MNTKRFTLLLLVLNAYWPCAFADGIDEPIPSFYQEPGVSRTRDYTDQHANERIDPFTGKLQWHFVDLAIPGNGGMDLKVQRSYSSLGEDWPEPSPAGAGWTMHFGRVIRRASVDICAMNTSATANPVLELPDGGRRVLYVALDGVSFITTDFWKAECDLTNGGLKVYSPDGTRYDMSLQGVSFGSPNNTQNVFYTSRITDRNGNWMSLTYELLATGGAAVTGITASDGRSVTFTYVGGALDKVSDGARTWTYITADAPGTIGQKQLLEVQRPGGTSWKYDYNAGDGSAGAYSLRRVTYPTGGTIDYTYDFVQFAVNPSIPRSTVVKQKVANPGAMSASSTWTWSYTPATEAFVPDANGHLNWSIPPENPNVMDRTTVTGPDETRTYYHMGYTSVPDGSVFAIGTLLGISSPIQNESFGFAPLQISYQGNRRPGGTLVFDSVTNAVLRTYHGIGRAKEYFSTSYGNFDQFGNPRTITENGNATRTTSVTYLNNTANWILRVKKDETIRQGTETYAISRTFDGNANMLSENRAGVTTSFTYTAEGDVHTRTDARDNTTTYGDYYRGIPRTENQPEGVTISRTVSSEGNVTAEMDGELATTGFSYDGLNRVTGITHARGNPVTVFWGPGTRKVTRGTLEQLTEYDGFGRAISLKHTDKANAQVITQTYKVDSLGRKVFSSYPNATSGTGFTFDMLNRPVYVLHEYTPGGTWASWRDYSYSEYNTELNDERGNFYRYYHRIFGHPESRQLIGVLDSESNYMATEIARNIAGQMTSVTQSGVVRTYGYDDHYFLTSMAEPETGTTMFSRDAVGNMTSRQVGTSPATAYVYDARNRLVAINYPAGTPSVVKTYYKDDKLKSVDNGTARRDYQYDGNKNLTNESLVTGAKAFGVAYAYNDNDALSTLTYGSGRSVSYSPDGFGRPTQVGAYVTSVAYHPSGQPSSYTYGNGVQTVIGLNARQWPNTLRITKGTDLFNTTYVYDDNGNVTSIGDSVDGSYSRLMTYDALDRLRTVNGPWGEGNIAYDQTGNITYQSFGGFGLSYTYEAGTERLASVSGSKAYTMEYDAYGNVTNNGTMTFNYNEASNMRCAKCGQPDEILFDYDGAGQRVRMQKNGGETYFVYGAGGQLLWEETPNSKLKEYIYLHGKAVATREQPLP